MKKKTLLLTIAFFPIVLSLSAQEKGTFTDSRDGKTYKTVKIGTQTWMAENLAFKSNNGCWAYDDEVANAAIYGYLYNWETAKAACPKGWHLPSVEEWTILVNYLGGDSIAGGKLKAIGTTYWTAPNAGASNQSVFSALPGGVNNSAAGGYLSIQVNSNWWSGTEFTEFGTNMAYKFSLSCYHKKVLKGGFSKVGGLSIRCIKDEVQNPDKSNDQSSKEDNKVDKNAQVNIAKIDNGHNVIIGTQTWHKTNLDVSTFRNGDTIPEAKTREEWKIAGEKGNPAWCYYENNSTNGQKYGKLYNWYAVSDNRNLAPLGWHIPTDAEWTILTDFLGGERNAGGKVKEAGTNNWAKPNAGSVDDDKATSTNETGLTLLPSGIRTSWLKFDGIGYGGNYWTSTEKDSKNTWSRDLSYIIGNVNKGYWTKKSGLSVRCIKDNL